MGRNRGYNVVSMAITLEAPTRTPEGRVTLRTVRRQARDGESIPILTCYDATTARHLFAGGVSCFLVGDTAAQVVLGHDTTLPASMPFMLEITAAVRRGAPNAFVIADMPFGSYQCGVDEAVRHAIAFLKEADADIVKFELDASWGPMASRLVASGVPVMAHLGSRPQQVRAAGGYRAAGRTRAEADEIVHAAETFIELGVAMLLLEAVPNEVAKRVVAAATADPDHVVPVIGCGGGNACHGHVVVLHDLLGLSQWQPPFAPPQSALGQQLAQAAHRWAKQIRSGEYLRDDHPYHMEDGELP